MIRIILILALTFSLQFSVKAQSFFADDGYVEFISRAPLLEFKGKSDNLTGKINFDENTVDFFVDLNTLNTGNRRRDRDMRNVYLKTEQFPFAEFYGAMLNQVDLARAEKQPIAVRGEFTIHGVEKEMTINGSITPNGEEILVEAYWTVLLKDHNIDRPSVVFYELSEEQQVNIRINLIKQ